MYLNKVHDSPMSEADVAEAEKAVAAAKLDAEIVMMECVQLHNSKKKNKGTKGEGMNLKSEADQTSLANAKANLEEAMKTVQAVMLAFTMEGAKAFKLYENLLSNEAGQSWEKIIKAQVTCTPWKDIYGVIQSRLPPRLVFFLQVSCVSPQTSVWVQCW